MTKRILVIEDDRTVAKLLGDVLGEKGHDVHTEQNGDWGLRYFEAKGADLIILDLLLPNMNGFEVLEKLRANEAGKKVPVIVLSGVYAAREHRTQLGRDFSIVDFLEKPVDIDLLRPLVEATLFDEPVTTLPPPPPAEVSEDGRELSPNLSQLYRGSFDQVSFAQLLGQAYGARQSGALMLRKSTIKKIVYLQQGIPVFVKSNLIEETLGQIMIRERLISPSENQESVERMKKEGRLQGEILIDMGCISPHNLEYGLERQMEVKLFDAFTWLDGKYMLNNESDYHGTQVALSMSPTELIYEGVRRSMSPDRIARELAKVKDRIVIPSADPTVRYQAAQLEPAAEKVLDAIDGKKTVRQLLDIPGVDKGRVGLLLYALTSSCLLNLVEERPAEELVRRRLERFGSSVVRAAPEAEEIGTSEIEPIGTSEVEAQDPGFEAIRAAAARARAAARAAHPQWTQELRALEREVDQEAVEADLVAAESEVTDAAPLPEPSARTPSGVTRMVPLPREPSKKAPTELAPPVSEVASETDSAATEAQPTAAPVLSDQVRREIRARLEADAASFISPSKEPPVPTSKRASKPVVPPESKAIVERERARLISELKAKVEQLRQKNRYERLGVHRHASAPEVEKAFSARYAEFDPEKTLSNNAPLEAYVLAEEARLLLKRAHDGLSHAVERAEYDRSLGGDDHDELAKMNVAESLFAAGLEASAAENWREARSHFDEAAALNPNEGAYLAHRAWASFSDSGHTETALEDLDRAIELSPRLEEAYVFRGRIFEKQGDHEKAIHNLRRAVQCNPDSVLALRMLRTLAPEPEKKGGLFGVFGS